MPSNRDLHYNLIFVLLWKDAQVPLILSQTFDQAQKQTEVEGKEKPNSVSVWIISPFKIVLQKETYRFLKQIRRRCPNVKVKVIPDLNKIGDFPTNFIYWIFRKIHRGNAVFHVRSESPMLEFCKHYKRQTQDILILDVRGYWPAELLYDNGIENVNKVPASLKRPYAIAKERLKKALKMADGVMTVSENLASLLQTLENSIDKIHIIPCCVDKINSGEKNTDIRGTLGVARVEKLLVYSGGYARYQHLEDLTIPFFKFLIEQDPKIKVLVLSQDIAKIKSIVESQGGIERFIFLKADQHEVADYLSACDLGFLIRKPTLVNHVAQPVKIGEYLAAGVPVCVEGQIGGVTSKLLDYDAGVSISISDKTPGEWDRAANMVLDFLNKKANKSQNAKSLAKDHFLWELNIPRQRAYYIEIIKNVHREKHTD